MGGSVGSALDTTLSLGGTLYDRDKGIKQYAEGVQKHYGDQITNMMNAPDDALNSVSDAVSSVAESSESAANANPFSMGSYGNSMRQRRKSGFGRRQTFKGLTG